jgi:hypothetical protein
MTSADPLDREQHGSTRAAKRWSKKFETATLLSKTEAATEWLFDIDCRANGMPDYLEAISPFCRLKFGSLLGGRFYESHWVPKRPARPLYQWLGGN